MPFETFGFATNYSVELNPEQPGVGWGGRTRVVVRPGPNDAVIAEVTPFGGEPWLAIDGGTKGPSPRLCATPNPELICFSPTSYEYDGALVNVNDATPTMVFERDVQAAYGSRELNLLFLVSNTDILAVGPDGPVWASDRLVLDDLTVLQVSADGIVCSGYDGGDRPIRFTIDPVTGRHLDGPVFKDPFRRKKPFASFFRRGAR